MRAACEHCLKPHQSEIGAKLCEALDGWEEAATHKSDIRLEMDGDLPRIQALREFLKLIEDAARELGA